MNGFNYCNKSMWGKMAILNLKQRNSPQRNGKSCPRLYIEPRGQDQFPGWSG